MPLDMTDFPLYDIAIETAVSMTPAQLSQKALFDLQHVQNLMALMWCQGVTWGVLHPQEAVSAHMFMANRLKAQREHQERQPPDPQRAPPDPEDSKNG
jgi:hypothetical protein